jgi:hypothetical protein
MKRNLDYRVAAHIRIALIVRGAHAAPMLSTSAMRDQIVNVRTNSAFFPKARKLLIAHRKFDDSRRAQKLTLPKTLDR